MRYAQFFTMGLLAMPAIVTAHTGAHSNTGLLAMLWHSLIEHAPLALLTLLIATLAYAVLRIGEVKKEGSE